MKKLYIAGPMTGIPQFNVPLFDRAALRLRQEGHEVVSPAELDSPEVRKQALASLDGDVTKLEKGTGETWGDMLARDVKVIADGGITDIVLLPNWYNSRGARLETTVGLLCGKGFFQYHDRPWPFLYAAHRGFVLDQMHEGFMTQIVKELKNAAV